MSTQQAIQEKTGWLHGMLPGKTHGECVNSLACTGLVFLGGMALTALSFFAERAVIRVARKVL